MAFWSGSQSEAGVYRGWLFLSLCLLSQDRLYRFSRYVCCFVFVCLFFYIKEHESLHFGPLHRRTPLHGNCSAHNRKALQRVVRSAQCITGGKLPALQDTYTTQCHRKAIKIIKDNNHPSACLFTLLSFRRRGQYRCIKAGTQRILNSFYIKAIRLLNSHH